MFSLMNFDFKGDVIDVLSQPVILHFTIKSKTFKHTPDFLMWVRGGALNLIDVKCGTEAEKEKHQRVFEWTEEACNYLGWRYEVCTEPDDTYLTNLKWLAGFRRRPPLPLLSRDVQSFIEAYANKATTIGDLLEGINHPPLARPILFHLLWKRVLKISMQILLSDESFVYFSGEDSRNG